MTSPVVTRNHTGHRVGACHQNANLTTAQVEAIRADYAAKRGGYIVLGRLHGCGASTVRDIVLFRTRWAA